MCCKQDQANTRAAFSGQGVGQEDTFQRGGRRVFPCVWEKRNISSGNLVHLCNLLHDAMKMVQLAWVLNGYLLTQAG